MVSRQAVKVGRRRSPGDILAGVAALAALAALLFGVPFALVTFLGSPIPDRMPTLDTLTQDLGPSSLLYVLAVLVWLAWAQLVACVLVEVYAGVRGIGVPARVPLAGGTQAVAHRLVVTALLLFTATTAIMPALTARDAPVTRPAQTQSQQYPPPRTPAENTQQMVQGIEAHHVEKQKVRKIYRVHPPQGRHHESLWEIAEKCLGDGRRYREIYTLNKGRQQPDGSRLTIASLIRPGWILEMPADAVGAHIVPVPDPERPALGQGSGRPADQATRPVPNQDNKPEVKPAQPGGQAGQSEQSGQAGQADRAGQAGQGDHAGQGDQAGGSEGTQEDQFFGWQQRLALASLLAAGLLAALGRQRRRQLFDRAFGEMIPAPSGDAALAEQALRIGADIEATRLLDAGLRQMSQALAGQGRTPPTVYGVHLGTESLDLWIAPADRNPPAPWVEYDHGQVWRLRRSVPVQHADDVLAPYPGLVSIGTNDTGRILVDLEAAHGLIALRGPEAARRAALAALAVELATNRWSDHMRITLVGFGEELSLVAPDRIRAVDSLKDALPELEARTEEVRQALAASGADSVLTGRCRGVFGEAWMPHYLIMAEPPTPEEAETLAALARTGQRMAAGYIVAADPGRTEGAPGATWTWDITAEGRLRAGVLGFDVEAQLIPDRHYRAVVELFRTAGRVDGVALRNLTEDPPVAARMADRGVRAAVDIRLLGPIEVEAPGPIEESRRPLCTEILVFLAMQPEGVHPTVLGGAVWPRGVPSSVRDATVARVADWLGRDSRGRPNLYYDERGRIRLGSEVRVDWEVFRWLLWRSAAEPASAAAYMSYALDLVRGPLLDGRSSGRYAWLATVDLEYEAVARVSDLAHRLLLLRLDDGDAVGAVAAARAGLRLAVDDEGLWRDLLRATHATGNQARLQAVVDELRRRVDGDPVIEQMQPETEALVDELMPQWRHAEGVGA